MLLVVSFEFEVENCGISTVNLGNYLGTFKVEYCVGTNVIGNYTFEVYIPHVDT